MKAQRRNVSYRAGRKSASRLEALRRFSLPEMLEARLMMSAYPVISNADSGAGTLRDAIQQVNLGNYDEIDFSFSSPTTIALGSA